MRSLPPGLTARLTRDPSSSVAPKSSSVASEVALRNLAVAPGEETTVLGSYVPTVAGNHSLRLTYRGANLTSIQVQRECSSLTT